MPVNLQRLISKAPVRICHAGEDLDWLGYKCCCSAVGLMTSIHVALGTDKHKSIYLDTTWEYIKRYFNLNLPPPEFTVTTEAPTASGLSTSSSLTIVLIEACLDYAGLPKISPTDLIKFAYEIEYSISKGGGMDQLTIVSQGTLLIQGCVSGVPQIIDITPWPEDFQVIIFNVRQPKSISDHIVDVRKQLKDSCPRLKRYIAAADLLATEAFYAIRAGNITKLNHSLNESHAIMRDIQLMSTERIEQVRDFAINAGCSGVKLTGSGGGGCLFSIVPKEDLDQILTRLINTRIKELHFDILTPKIV